MSDFSELEFIDDKEREYFARARIGESVRAFLRSDAGRYIHGRAKLVVDAAKEQLVDCNLWTPWGRRRARRLQREAEIGRKIISFCVDAIQDGEVAFRELSERENSQD